MNYETLWHTLELLVVELRQKGSVIPQEIGDDLKSARTLLTIYRTEPAASNVEPELAMYLERIGPILLSLAESDVGSGYADSWQDKLNPARVEILEAPIATPRFIPGIPRGQDWLRIKTSEMVGDIDINKITQDLSLTTRPQADGFLLIYGDKENVKTFIEALRDKVSKRKLVDR